MESKRVLYLDILKVIASLAVVFIHAAASKWYVLPVGSTEWSFLNLVNVLTRYSVPLFVMVTGVIMLQPSKNLSFNLLIKKYVFKALLFFYIGSSLFALASFFTDPHTYSTFEVLQQFVYRTVKGPSHLWYLFMIAGLYLITPFIKKITDHDPKLTLSFVVLAFVVNSIMHLNLIFEIDTVFLYTGYFNITLGTGFAMYYVWGFYLSEAVLSKKIKRLIHSVALISLPATYVLTQIYSIKTGKAFENFYGYLLPTIFFMATSLFVLMKDSEQIFKSLPKRVIRTITDLSKVNLIIYIIHPLMITLISPFLSTFKLTFVPYILLLGLISYLLSSGLALALKRIPVLGKWI